MGLPYWRTPGDEFALQLEPRAWNVINRLCGDAGDTETGGILIGRYSTDGTTAVVTEASGPPRDSGSGHSWFRRGVAGLTRLLRNRWGSRERTYYLGEWHYHPARTVEPSDDDIRQMREIGRSSDYKCREPIMVIAGRPDEGGRRPTRAFVVPVGGPVLEFGRPLPE